MFKAIEKSMKVDICICIHTDQDCYPTGSNVYKARTSSYQAYTACIKTSSTLGLRACLSPRSPRRRLGCRGSRPSVGGDICNQQHG